VKAAKRRRVTGRKRLGRSSAPDAPNEGSIRLKIVLRRSAVRKPSPVAPRNLGLWRCPADAYDGYNKLYSPDRKPGPIQEAACWVHARRPFFAMADIEENARRKASGKKEIPLSPIAVTTR
jgi:Transposase IS66 family